MKINVAITKTHEINETIIKTNRSVSLRNIISHIYEKYKAIFIFIIRFMYSLYSLYTLYFKKQNSTNTAINENHMKIVYT